ncbi:hypothetical protein ACWD01_00315 [Streptomyces sp. NPDC002835]
MDGPTDFNQLEIERGDLTRIIRATAEGPNACKKMVNCHAVGGLPTPTPIVGDGVQRSVDWGLSASLNDDSAKVDAETL